MNKALLTTALVLGVLSPLSYSAEVLKDHGETWEYLMARDALGDAINPNRISLEFPTTWMDPDRLGYVDPLFGNMFIEGTGYFGYGMIGTTVISTNVWNPEGLLLTDEPASGERGAVYFRTTVTPTEATKAIRFSGIIDDGAIIYLDGVEVMRINMPNGEPDLWDLLASAGGDENVEVDELLQIVLPADIPVVVAVSVHNSGLASSDLGFDLRMESLDRIVPSNDNFVDAIDLTGGVLSTVATNGDGAGLLGASKEAGEPLHADNAGAGSVWWKWTPRFNGRVSVSTDGSDFNTLLGIYTGDAVDELETVSRFENLNVAAVSAAEPFHPASRVEFNATVGMTYYIAVDGADGEFGTIMLQVSSYYSPLDPVAELIPSGSDWEYLLALNGVTPIDPETLDPDFDATWALPLGYDGPIFAGPAPAPLGYGTINADPLGTDIWGGLDADGDLLPDPAPPSGARWATYYRTKFTPSAEVVHLGFEGLIDDGAIIYLDGLEAARVNVGAAKDANDWQVTADTANPASGNSENGPQVVFALDHPLQAGVEVDIAVSVHNTSGTSSDMGFDLRVWSTNLPLDPPPSAPFAAVVSKTLTEGEYLIKWTSQPTKTYLVEFSPNLEDWVVISLVIAADPSGENTVLDFPGGTSGYYRVVEQ